jgi:hypothetical protein
LILFACVSFRAVPRILGFFLSAAEWIPHFTSVINWTLRVGLALLNQVAPVNDAWVVILDHSIDIGVKKVLVALRVRVEALAQRGSALQLSDCECIGIQISEKTDGETVAAGLKNIFEQSGVPAAIIKDGGSDLSRGVELWQEQSQKQVEVIDDIGHVVANSLKSQYAKSKLFLLFLEIINRCAKKLRQTKLAFLAPPKLRSKGRFQGINNLAKWAEKVLLVLDETRQNPEYKKLRSALFGLSKVKNFIRGFAESVITTSEIMKILKNEGLNQESYQRCHDLVTLLPGRSKIKRRISEWLNKHLEIQKRMNLNDTALIVSSDIIESLFGKFKHIIERGSMLDMNRSVLLIPTLCGKLNGDSIQNALQTTGHTAIHSWDYANVPCTQNRRRHHFLRKNSAWTVPKTGDFLSQTG